VSSVARTGLNALLCSIEKINSISVQEIATGFSG
jgi:hypothetical protein